MRKLIPLLLVLLIATAAYAQNKGRIVGTVTTTEGAVITGAKVTIASDALIARTMATVTNERGMFRFVLLPVGTYSIKLEKEGYETIEQTGIDLGYDVTVSLEKVMNPAEFERVVTITGEAPLVDKTSSGIGDKLDTEFLQNMPNDRDVWDLPNLSAGFTDDSGFGGVQDSGQAYNTDGVNVSDPATGTVFSSINFEAVEQVDVSLFGAPAEYGAFTGASLNVVTKSGGNEFHGEINYFHQAVNWVSDNTTEYTEYGVSAPTAAKVVDPNFAVGGPILRDRAWFFTNYNYNKSETEIELLDTVVTQGQPTKRLFLKASGMWDDRNISYVSWIKYNYADSHRKYWWPSDSWRTKRENDLWEQESRSDTYLLQHSYVLRDDLILEGRFAGFRGGFQLIPKNGRDTPLMYDYGLGEYLPGSSANREDDLTRNRDNLLITTNYFNDNLHGMHSMKFGFEWERSLSRRWMSLTDLRTYFYGLSYVRYDLGVRDAGTVVTRFAGYAQDSWNITDRLTLNLGFRFDSSGLSSNNPDQAAVGSDTFARFGDPAFRVGFAYDIFGDGKTVVRGFAGRYYEGVIVGNTEPLVGYTPPQITYYGRYIMGDDAPEWTYWSTSGGTGNFAVGDIMKNQYTQGLTLGVERELTPVIAASVTYIYKKDTDILGIIDPESTWDTANADFSNENGSYSGVYYPNYLSSGMEIYQTITENDHGVMGPIYRRYQGLVFELNKRMSDKWSLRANYTYSRNTGTLSQHYQSIQGFTSYDNPNGWINAEGHLLIERPHVLKFSGTYIAPFDVYVSPAVTYFTGWPFAKTVTIGDANFYINPVDGKDRYENQFNVDLRLEKAFILAEKYRIGVIFDAFNLFNDDAVTRYASRDITSSRYLWPSEIVDARFYQIGVRFLF